MNIHYGYKLVKPEYALKVLSYRPTFVDYVLSGLFFFTVSCVATIGICFSLIYAPDTFAVAFVFAMVFARIT